MEPPLVVDLDGTLLRSDLLIETGLEFLRDKPLRALAPLQWLLQGKAALKHELAHATNTDMSVLPYEQSVIEFIEAERGRGRRVILATASHHLLAERVAAHLGLFDEVIASNAERNLSAQSKRDALIASFGDCGFDYVGNSRDDLAVWGAARHAYIVNASRDVERRARKVGNVAAVLDSDRSTPRDWMKALRLHQWLKNLLIFVPLLAAHLYTDVTRVVEAILAFLCFGLCASSVYILNDLLDLRDDRHHPRKRFRPFAAGRLSIPAGLVAFPVLLVTAFALALWMLPPVFTAGLATYYVLTLAYSLKLKRLMVVDVIALAGLYTTRVIVGSFAVEIPLSFWLLAFSMFIFLSLALVKRYAELFEARARGSKKRARGRGYFPSDLEMIASLGAASGYMAVMVLALYINEVRTAQLYRRPEIIWFCCPLLLMWISRVWMLAHRGRMHEDPVLFAVHDRASLATTALLALVLWVAK
ncbi:UbiA family prenyltransferase [Azoarcus sp. KH32C]|uniref:UbiA family prenyltransferase n=1 Tax=Azoarcus sp. KH32C TaxID=748247 RepID=UPI0003490B32|nr:UbiA family prenyltransferase [Azoarcus sp. KH32C]